MSKTESTNPWKNLVAGGCSGAIEAGLMFPTEFVKTRMQLLEAKSGKSTGMIAVIKDTYTTKGVRGFYSGVSSLVIGSIPKAAIRFWAFNTLSSFAKDDKGKLSGFNSMLCGVGTGMAEAIFAVTPTETIKTKLIHDQQSAQPKYKGLIHGTRMMISEGGIGAIYKGLFPTMLRQSANSAVRFTVYGSVKSYIQNGDAKRDLTVSESFGAGICAGVINVYVTMPFDVVKTRMQGLQAARYTGVGNCFTTILREDGVLALWKGTIPRLSRVGLSGGVVFTSFETVMKGLNYVWPEGKKQ